MKSAGFNCRGTRLCGAAFTQIRDAATAIRRHDFCGSFCGIKMDSQERFEFYRERIRDLREERNISQEKLARVINVEQKSISDYERGRTRIPVSSLIKLARFFDVSMDYITGVSNERRHFPLK